MELRNLNTFVKIAELGSFSAAAQELGYTQSTVTMQIKNLEEELGVQLFDRIGRSIRLTDAGSAALGRAREVLHSASRLREDLAGAGSAQVRVGVYESLCGAFLPGLIQQFARQNPSAGLSVVTASKAELERLLLADQIDLLWIYGREKRENMLVLEEFEHPISPVCCSSSPLAGTGPVPLGELLRHRAIFTEQGCPYRRQMERFLEEKEAQADVFLEASSTDVVLKFIRAGLGFGFLPQFLTGEEIAQGELAAFEVEGFSPRLYSRILCHRDKWLTGAMRSFCQLARRLGQQPQPEGVPPGILPGDGAYTP